MTLVRRDAANNSGPTAPPVPRVTALTDLTHDAVNIALVPLIPQSAVRILDVGCGTGAFGAHLKIGRADRTVVGVTISEREAEEARTHLDQVRVCDLNRDTIAGLGAFDVIVCSHVLGYFYRTEAVLEALKTNLAPDGLLVAAIPNVLHWRQRIELLRGRFDYTNYGVLHRYYVRFFDRRSAYTTLEAAGYEVVERAADGYFPLPGLRSAAPRLAAGADRLAVQLRPGLFATQFLVAARPRQASEKDRE